MRAQDYVGAWTMRASARFTVRYGEPLRFAGNELPRPTRRAIDTRHGRVRVEVYDGTPGCGVLVHFHGGAFLMRYPRMDDLVEVEGDPDAIERGIAATGLPREGFSSEPLREFVARYEQRTGGRAALADTELADTELADTELADTELADDELEDAEP